MKDSRTLLMALLSVSLISTWIYHLYDKNKYSKITREVYIKDSIAVAEAVSDSLQKLFSQTLNKLGQEKLNIDSINLELKGELSVQVSKINNLKDEISSILRRKNITQADLDEAKVKINELQSRIGSLQGENTLLADEKTKMNNLLTQLNTEMVALQLNMNKVSAENKQLYQTLSTASTFIASEMKLLAVTLKSGDKELPTTQVKKAEKFVVSFSVQNNIVNYPNAEVVIVITDPTGKTITGDIWDSGSFETKNDGRKPFTRKMKFEYQRMESKQLLFSIQPDDFVKGTYKFQLYHEGVRIGETYCKLG